MQSCELLRICASKKVEGEGNSRDRRCGPVECAGQLDSILRIPLLCFLPAAGLSTCKNKLNHETRYSARGPHARGDQLVFTSAWYTLKISIIFHEISKIQRVLDELTGDLVGDTSVCSNGRKEEKGGRMGGRVIDLN